MREETHVSWIRRTHSDSIKRLRKSVVALVEWNQAQEYEELLTGREVDCYKESYGYTNTGHTARFYRAFLIDCILDDIARIKELAPELSKTISEMIHEEVKCGQSNCGEIRE